MRPVPSHASTLVDELDSSDSALASVSGEGTRDLTRLRLRLERLDLIAPTNRLAVDGILKALDDRFQVRDPQLQKLDLLRAFGLGSLTLGRQLQLGLRRFSLATV